MNYKYIYLNLLLIFSNLMSMDLEKSESDTDYPGQSKKSNRLPSKLAKILISNSFFESPQTASLEDNSWLDMDWAGWTEEEIDIICDILNLEEVRSFTPKILVYLYSLESLFLCIEYDKENIKFKSRQEISRLNSLLSFKNLVSSLINSNNNI